VASVLQNDLFELIDGLNAARSAAEVHRRFRRFLDQNAFETLIARSIGNPFGDEALPDIYDGPPEWRERYLSLGYVRHDPNVLQGLRSHVPFLWGPIRERATGLGRRILDEGASFGMREGICLPVHSLDQQPACIGISGDRARTLSRDDILTLGLAGTHFFVAWSGFVTPDEELPPGPLTPRERDVLYAAAAGLTGDRMREKLGVGEETIRSHMRSIRQKLGASSMAHAVAKGIRFGEIAQ
jgi:LuxR family quorum sensing-dependent transcriptional regulator